MKTAQKFVSSTLFTSALLTTLLAGCSFYSSAGRKQFEEKAPSQIVQPQGFQLLGCGELTEAAWREKVADSELIQRTLQHEVYSQTTANGEVEVIVFSAQQATPLTEGCYYSFSSPQSWQSLQSAFLSETVPAMNHRSSLQ
jgi:hypothetical protein